MRFLKNKKIAYLILAGLCFLVYANSLNNQFIYDDIPNIIKSQTIHKPQNFIFNLPMLVNSCNYLLSRENPFTYRLCNVIVHALNTILLFIFLQLFFEIEPSFLGAALFAVHPVHTEAVVWITAGNYLYYLLFVFITYLLYRSASDPLEKGKKLKVFPYIFCLIVFTYALLWQGLTFYWMVPFLLIFSDLTFRKWRNNWKLWGVFLAIFAMRIFIMKAVIAERIAQVTQEIGATSNNPPIVDLAYSLWTHLLILLWPAKLTLYHEVRGTPLFTQAGLLALLVLIFSLPFIYKKSKEIFFAIGIFVLFLLPTASPIPITSLIAERYIYIPSVALSMFVAYYYQRYALKDKIWRKRALVVFAVLLAAFSIRTKVRNEDWRSPENMWQKTLETSPDTPFSHNNMGFIYQQQGKFEEAIEEYKKAIDMKPNFFDAYNNLALVYRSAGKNTEAIDIYKKIIEISPGYAKAYNNLAGLYNELGKKKEAEDYYNKAIQIDPTYAYAYFNLGLLYEEGGKKEEAKQMYDKAFQLYPRLKFEISQMNIKPSMPVGQLEVKEAANSKAMQEKKAPSTLPAGGAKLKKKERNVVGATKPVVSTVEPVKKITSTGPTSTVPISTIPTSTIPITAPISKSILGEKTLSTSTFSKPTAAQEYNAQGVQYSMAGKHEEALDAYKKAVELNPDFSDAYNNMGNSYNSLGKTQEAIEAYKKAIDINPSNPAAHFNLSISYYDSQQFDLAITHCDIAKQLGYQVPKDYLNLLKRYRK